MRDKSPSLAELAERQHGVVALWQLVELGRTRQAVHRWVKAGRLHALYRGVYAVGHRKLSRQGWIMAAVLAHGPEAVAPRSGPNVHSSRRSAWGCSTGA